MTMPMVGGVEISDSVFFGLILCLEDIFCEESCAVGICSNQRQSRQRGLVLSSL